LEADMPTPIHPSHPSHPIPLSVQPAALMHTTNSACRRRGFTLIELLIVVGIIGLLVATTLLVGGAAVGGARRSVTEDTLRVLDAALEQYIASEDIIPPALVQDPRPGRTTFVLPVADVRSMADNAMIDSVGLFLLQANTIPDAKKSLDQLPQKFVRQQTTTLSANPLTITSVFDAWGEPIRYVHPQFSGRITTVTPINSVELLGPAPAGKQYGVTDVRRNNVTASPQDIADGDGGKCIGGRPYFYSAGPDKDPSTIDDNVYLIVPPVPRS
jgi:prepilin-type N-terminal cleavage/methylation domain-containing protein